MTGHYVRIMNESDQHVSYVTPDIKGSAIAAPKRKTRLATKVPDKPEEKSGIQTKKGLLWTWASDGQIQGQWEFDSSPHALHRVDKDGQHFALNVTADGAVSVSEATQ
ncbi:hypothetical protein [Streptomyces palmae]|uniref:Uncharacterized protein n=1 Tax=Streptomyces palmae TaxID=1701085 RepID=A0A4Z0HE60_9ACTN|nr:hypothetical protein [Streptomyces palmae]TGB19591.1 hypothetical protein E4099_00100 [Streptomyces palmae]